MRILILLIFIGCDSRVISIEEEPWQLGHPMCVGTVKIDTLTLLDSTYGMINRRYND